MPFMEWDDLYSVKADVLDEQHKQLFLLVNNLYDSVMGENNKEVLSDAFTSLSEYVNYHFKAEELHMKSIGYPDLHAHQIEHNEFVNKLVDLLEETPCNEPTIAQDTLAFLQDWLVQHILQSDKKYAQHSRNNPHQ